MKRLYNYFKVSFEDYSFIDITITDNDTLEVHFPDDTIIMWFSDNVKNAYIFLMGVLRSCINGTFYDQYI